MLQLGSQALGSLSRRFICRLIPSDRQEEVRVTEAQAKLARCHSRLITAHDRAVVALQEMRSAREQFERAESYFHYCAQIEMDGISRGEAGEHGMRGGETGEQAV